MTALGLVVVACGGDRGRPVEAPIVDVPVAAVDGGPRAEVAIAAPPPAVAAGFVGRFRGIGRQDDGQSWPMVVTITTTAAGECAAVEYPSIPCRAVWLCTDDRGGVLEARERLVDDHAHRCVDDGAMTMRLRPDGGLDWSWRGSGQTASARLSRDR